MRVSSAQRSEEKPEVPFLSRMKTEICIIAHLVFFSIIGTLARLGVEWLAFYLGTPSVFPVLWANFGGPSSRVLS
jgi:fluoride exporter